MQISHSMMPGFHEWRKTVPELRYGQAFFNYFNLHRLSGESYKQCEPLYYADDASAMKLVESMIDYNN